MDIPVSLVVLMSFGGRFLVIDTIFIVTVKDFSINSQFSVYNFSEGLVLIGLFGVLRLISHNRFIKRRMG